MKFSVKWLREYLEFSCSLDDLSNKLTSLGLEVEKIDDPSKLLDDFTVCEITKISKHPNADKLSICEVFDGKKFLQIVCGASNARKGLKTVLASVGVELPSNEFKKIIIKKNEIRGIESSGMLCSSEELGIESSSQGIIELSEKIKTGDKFSSHIDQELITLEIAITPNRPDCAGVLGIARDLGSTGIGVFKDKKNLKCKEKFKSNFEIENKLLDKDCPNFSMRMIKDVKNSDSSDELTKRLNYCGIKVISKLVDITNLVCVERCRPLHVFDYDKIKGKIVVRHSNKDEKFVGLDGVTYKLDEGMIVICDDTGIISLAGILGGQSSACDVNTKNILLESAYFNPEKIASTGRKLFIESDARYRFERGIDPDSILEGLDYATNLIVKHCGGSVGSIISTNLNKKQDNKILINTSDLNNLIGFEFKTSFIEETLEKIGCKTNQSDGFIEVRTPSWRVDLKIKEDLIEEVARLFGYENIPGKPIKNDLEVQHHVTSKSQKLKRLIGRNLVNCGLMELITWSFVDEKFEDIINSEQEKIKITNPISSELSCLRSSLIINLLSAIIKNFKRGYKKLGFFEIGPVFKGPNPGDQEISISGMRSGPMVIKDWHERSRNVDIYDIKADFLKVMEVLNFNEENLNIKNSYLPDFFHPGKAASVLVGKDIVGYFGMLHPIFLKKFNINFDVAFFEINFSKIQGFYKQKKISRKKYEPSPFQLSTRDFSFILNKHILSSELVREIKKTDQKLIKSVKIFDLFLGQEIDNTKKAIAIEVIIQSKEKTLKDDELEIISENLISNIEEKFDAKLR